MLDKFCSLLIFQGNFTCFLLGHYYFVTSEIFIAVKNSQLVQLNFMSQDLMLLVDVTTMTTFDSTNSSFGNNSNNNSMDIYFGESIPDVLALRFVPFTILAAICFVLNLLSLLAMRETRRTQLKVNNCMQPTAITNWAIIGEISGTTYIPIYL